MGRQNKKSKFLDQVESSSKFKCYGKRINCIIQLIKLAHAEKRSMGSIVDFYPIATTMSSAMARVGAGMPSAYVW